MEKNFVTKRDGSRELLNLDKILKVLNWAAEGLDVSVTQVLMNIKIKLRNNIETSSIHDALVKTASDMVDIEQPDYQYMAGRLLMFALRKEAFCSHEIPDFYEHIGNLVKTGFYDKEILEIYSKEEIDELGRYMDHTRDWNLTIAAASEMRDKYLLRTRAHTTKSKPRVMESPQHIYMLVAMCLFGRENKDVRLDYVKRYYDATSLFKISLPSPIMNGVRSPNRQFSSCVLIEADDSLDSIMAAGNSIIQYVSRRAGIGLNVGAIRSKGSAIRNGEVEHAGPIPFYRNLASAVKSCSQGGARDGSATFYYPIWHKDAIDLFSLKNNRGSEDTRVRSVDYGVQIPNLFMRKLNDKENPNVNLFCPNEAKGLYDSFFKGEEEFTKKYNECSADKSISRVEVSAIELLSKMMNERSITGRIYTQHVDNISAYGPFKPEKAPVRMSNLCAEILLPTSPVSLKDPSKGEIALCTLSAFNLGAIEKLSDLEELSELAVRALDNLLDYQDYPLEAARKALKRRSLGIGLINYAYWLAKQGYSYDDKEANDKTHEMAEAVQYYLLKASNNLAKEKGKCEWFDDTRYADGSLPIDRYKEKVDELHNAKLKLDWDGLREDVLKYGLRNSTLTSLMPSESSSKVSNATNGIEPARSLRSVKVNRTSAVSQLVPEVKRLRNVYKTVWELKDNRGYLDKMAIMQKFFDQSISANLYYDPMREAEGDGSGINLSMHRLVGDLAYAMRYGLRTLYYSNTRDYSGSEDDLMEHQVGCDGGACTI